VRLARRNIKTRASLVSCRRAVSAVFSVLLMVIIVFVAGIFLYNFVSGMMENMTSSTSNQLFSLRIENVAVNNTCMTIHIGNQLNYDVAVTRVYINNEPHDLLFNTGDGVKIPKTASGPVYVTGSYTAGAMYDVKVVFDSGQSLITVVRY
jgi:FlaG/FlaF family flagellin (archaellin)